MTIGVRRHTLKTCLADLADRTYYLGCYLRRSFRRLGAILRNLRYPQPEALPAGPVYVPPPRPTGPYWHYCVVRADLPPGTLAAMLVHAAGESAMRAEDWCYEPQDTQCEACRHDYQRGYGWAYDEGCGVCMGYGYTADAPIHAVVLTVKNEVELAEVEQRLALAEIHHRSIREPDPPWDGALMAIGIEPTRDRASLRPVLGKLKLLGGRHGQGTVSRSHQDAQGSREGGRPE